MRSLLTTLAFSLVTVGGVAHAQEPAITSVPGGVQVAGTPAVVAPKAPKQPSMQLELPPFSLETRTFNYPSGLRVLMQPDHTAPLVGVTMWVDRGSNADPIGKEGIAHFVEHLWFKSKHGEGVPKVWDLLTEMGCYLNASTSNDWTNYMTVCPAEHLDMLLKLESLRLTDPVTGVLEEEEFFPEREVVRNELRMRFEGSGGEVFRYLFGHLYPDGHPYQRETIGTHGTLSNIRMADIKAFTDLNYRPENATIAVVGDFDPNEASSLLVRNFALENLAPGATEDEVARYPAPGVESPDPKDPDDWYYLLMDPKNPKVPLDTSAPFTSRIPEQPEPPVAVPKERVFHEVAPIDRPEIVIAWSVPGGYRETDGTWNLVANIASQSMWWRFQDPGQERSLSGDPRVYTDPDAGEKSVGCFFQPAFHASTVACIIELSSSKVDAEAVAREALNQIYDTWQLPESELDIRSQARNFGRGQMSTITDMLLSVDQVASLSGRATSLAEAAHYRGTASYFSDSMNEVMGTDLQAARDLAFVHIQRDRAVTVILTPLPEEELVTDSSEAAYHGATRDTETVSSGTDPSILTPDFIASQTVMPDLSEKREVVLDNGLRVIVVPHGEAPVAEVRLVFRGGTITDPPGLFDFANEYSTSIAFSGTAYDPLAYAGKMYQGVDDTWYFRSILSSAGNVDASLWTLREWVDNLHPYTSGKGSWVRDGHADLRKNWRSDDPAWFRSRIAGEHLNPGHPVTAVLSWDDYDAMKSWGADEVRGYLQSFRQPANATLMIIGNIDADEALERARYNFGGWQAAEGVTGGKLDLPAPNPAGPSRVVLMDQVKTQTDVRYYCPLAPATSENLADQEVASKVLDDIAWRVLREQAGATYGAGSGLMRYSGGTSYLYMSSLVQNDATPLAIQTFQKIAQDASDGKIDGDRARILTLNLARQYGLGQQSVRQLSGRLMPVVIEPTPDWDDFNAMGRKFGNVSVESIQAAMGDCTDHALVVAAGPIKTIGPMLDAAGVKYEVVDWKAEADGLLEQYDPKAYKKMMKSRAKAAANEASGSAE